MGGAKHEAGLAEQRRGRERLMADAVSLIAGGRFDEAERLIAERDASPEATVMLAKCYRECLRAAVATGADRNLVMRMHERALAAAMRGYPDPHTAIEGEQFERFRSEDAAALAAIVTQRGWTPGGDR